MTTRPALHNHIVRLHGYKRAIQHCFDNGSLWYICGTNIDNPCLALSKYDAHYQLWSFHHCYRLAVQQQPGALMPPANYCLSPSVHAVSEVEALS